MKLFSSSIFRARIKNYKFLAPIALLFFFLVFTNQKFVHSKDFPTHSKLTIEKAKDLFSRTEVRDFEVHSRGGEENDDDYAIYMTLGWNNGSEYHDSINNLDVIEFPILHSNLLKTFDVVSDGDESNGYTNNGQKEILLVTQDAYGIVNFAILKISGTTDYLATHNMNNVSYKSLGPNFSGMAQYYNLKDSLLEGYLFSSGYVYKVEAYNEGGYHGSEVQDRWGYCIVGWQTVKNCTGSGNHNCLERSLCECTGDNTCQPPICIALLEICAGPWLNVPPNIIPPLVSTGNTVGSGGGAINTGNCNCANSLIDEYFTNEKVELVWPFSGFWFNQYYVLVGTNCKNGTFTSGTYKTVLAPGQNARGQEIEPSVEMDYFEPDFKSQLSPCKWQVATLASGNITYSVVYSVLLFTMEDHRTFHYDRQPTFIFE